MIKIPQRIHEACGPSKKPETILLQEMQTLVLAETNFKSQLNQLNILLQPQADGTLIIDLSVLGRVSCLSICSEPLLFAWEQIWLFKVGC